MARAPLWTARPSRFAGFRKTPARVALAALVALVALSLTALAVPQPASLDAITGADSQTTDLLLYENIVAGVRHGDGYYRVASDAMRAADYPLRPFVTTRLPALAVIEGALPEAATVALLLCLAIAVGIAWGLRLGEAIPRAVPRVAAAILLTGSMLVFVQPALAAFHEIWAALLIALSLALRKPGRWIEAVALGLMAILIRETAVVYVLVMALFAWIEGERREAAGWGAALALFALAIAAHAYAVLQVTSPADPASPGWVGLWGFGLFVKAIVQATALAMLPLWLAAPIVALALFGWLSLGGPLGTRMAAILLGYAMLIGIFARIDNFYWGLMVAPVFLAGLVFVPDGLRDLGARALDRRRVRVQRVSR